MRLPITTTTDRLRRIARRLDTDRALASDIRDVYRADQRRRGKARVERQVVVVR